MRSRAELPIHHLALGLFKADGHYHEPLSAALILSHQALPTTDFYLSARFRNLKDVRCGFVDTSQDHHQRIDLRKGTYVIIVRYIPRQWLHWLKKNRSLLAGVVLLLDDDVPAALTDTALPFRYAAKTAWRYIRTRRLLAELCDAIWVSTPYLQQKYPEVKTCLLPPLYLPATEEVAGSDCTYFYHGTAAHRLEMEFLVEVVGQVQSRLPAAKFEIFGNRSVRKLFAQIPGVHVLKPLTWPDYLNHTRSIRHAVGLAPLLDTPFNRARSHVKFFDITRCGAAGIYSDAPAYRSIVRSGHNGLLCANDPAQWASQIICLLTDAAKRTSLYRNALEQCRQLVDDPHFKLPLTAS